MNGTISLKVSETLFRSLEQEARLRRTSKSSIVGERLEKALYPDRLKSAASCYDLAHDLAGSVKGPPRDLATNPKYLEGFGQ